MGVIWVVASALWQLRAVGPWVWLVMLVVAAEGCSLVLLLMGPWGSVWCQPQCSWVQAAWLLVLLLEGCSTQGAVQQLLQLSWGAAVHFQAAAENCQQLHATKQSAGAQPSM
jgi:hypothetical protein